MDYVYVKKSRSVGFSEFVTENFSEFVTENFSEFVTDNMRKYMVYEALRKVCRAWGTSKGSVMCGKIGETGGRRDAGAGVQAGVRVRGGHAQQR